MSYSPKISVIVPVYNAEHTIIETLDSIRNQAFTDFEVIIVNDGSTDNSQALLKDYISSDQRFQLITQNNAGVSAARNTGLDNVRGEWVCFIDSDDLIGERYLEKLYENSSNDYLICCSSIFEFKDNINNVIRLWNIDKNNLDKPLSYILNNKLGVYIWGKLYQAEKLDNIRFNPDICVGEDFEFNIKYAQCVEGIKFVETCYFYRILNSSLSNSFKESLVLARLSAAISMVESITTDRISREEKDLLYINFGIIGSLRYLLKNKKYMFVKELAKNIDFSFMKVKHVFSLNKKWVPLYLVIYIIAKCVK